MSTPARFLFTNGVVSSAGDAPTISTFLGTHPGAYTTTRTHNDGNHLLFWDRHLRRLSNSLQILLNSNPSLVFGPGVSGSVPFWSSVNWDGLIRRRVDATMRKALPFALGKRNSGEELAISALIGGNCEELEGIVGRIDEDTVDRVLDVYVHIGMYVPPIFGSEGSGARLAVVGSKRDFAEAKYSDWARLRKPLEKLRPPSATEILLADHGGKILEGSVTNFFVVCFKGNSEVEENRANEKGNLRLYELQTAPVHDGVLPGVIRQLVIEICSSKGISVREVSPSWSDCCRWEEAFVTSSLRLVQHVETIQAPNSWTSMRSKSWSEIAWVEKHFKGGPGMITTLIQVLGSANVCCTLMRSHANAPWVRQTYAVGMFCQFEPNNVAMQLHHSQEIMKRTGLEGYLPGLLG